MKRTRDERDEGKEIVDQKDVLFSTPLQIFKSKPYSDTFEEFREVTVHASPVNPLSDVYSFTRSANNVGLLKTSDALISANVSIRTAAGVICTANSGAMVPPCLLRTIWGSKQVFVDDVLISSESSNGGIASYIKLLTRETSKMWTDSSDINLHALDTATARTTHNNITSTLDGTTTNVGGYSRVVALRAANKPMIDRIDTILFNEAGMDVFLPSVFKLQLQFARELQNRYISGTTHADFPIAGLHVYLDDLKIKIPVYKPKAQLSLAINAMLVDKNEECRYYTTSFRTIAVPVTAGQRVHDQIDVFNGAVPTRAYVMYQAQANYNGTHATNMFTFQWTAGWPNKIEFSVNGVIYKTMMSSEECYMELRKVLNRKVGEMPFTHAQYDNGFGIVATDLTSCQDSHLTVLPLRPAGVVNCKIEFSANTAEGFLIFVGEFRNEIKIGLKTPARSLHHF